MATNKETKKIDDMDDRKFLLRTWLLGAVVCGLLLSVYYGHQWFTEHHPEFVDKVIHIIWSLLTDLLLPAIMVLAGGLIIPVVVGVAFVILYIIILVSFEHTIVFEILNRWGAWWFDEKPTKEKWRKK